MNNETPQETTPSRKRRAWRYGLAGVLGVWALSWVFLATVAPGFVERGAAQWARGIGRTLTIGQVAIRPWSMSVELDRVRLLDRDGRPMFSAARVVMDAMPRALLLGHWHAELLALDQPQWYVERNARGSWNWVRLMNDAAGPKPSSATNKTPAIWLDWLRLTAGQLHFQDRLGGDVKRYDIHNVNLNLHDLSTLPVEGGYALSAAFGPRTTLNWRGSLELDPLVSAGRIRVQALDLASVWGYVAPLVHLSAPQGSVSLDMNYQFRLDRAVPRLSLNSLYAELNGLYLLAPDGQHHFALRQLALNDGIVDLQQHSLFFKRINLKDGDLSAARSADGKLNWMAALPAPSTAAHQPAQAGAPAWKLQVNDLRLENWSLALSDDSRQQRLQLNAKLPLLSLALRQSPRQGLRVDQLQLSLAQVALNQMGQEPLLKIAGLNWQGLSLADQRIQPGSLTLLQPILNLQRGADGAINLQRAFAARVNAPARGAPAAATSAWQWSLPQLALNGGQVLWRDAHNTRPVNLSLDQIKGHLMPHSADHKLDAQLSAQTGRGRLDVSAVLDPDAMGAVGTVKVRAWPLAPLAPYALGATPVTAASGSLSSSLALHLTPHGWSLDGQAGIADLALLEPGVNSPLLGWRALNLTGLKVSGSPLVISIRNVQLDRPQARLVLDEHRVSNFRRLFAPASAASAPAASPAPVSGKTTMPLFDLRALHIKNADVDFSDLGMKPSFSAQIHQLSGSISGLSSRPGRRGTLALNGAVDQAGDVRVSGMLEPLAISDNADISLLFRNIALSSLDTYAENIAGWQIADGRLSVQLHYLLSHRQLKGDNRVVIDSIRLGPQIERPGVSHLPLSLAVAVLADSNGRIDLQLPVAGNLDDPTFSYGGVVWQAFVNVIEKVATAPLRALGSLFGVEGFDDVRFVAGEAAVAPPERQKLSQLAQMLAKRPQLKLTLSGTYDPDADRQQLARARADRAILDAAGRALEPDEPLPILDMQDPEIQVAVKKVYAQRVGRLKLLSRLVSGNGRADFYAALRQEIIVAEPVDSAALVALANARAQGALQFLQLGAPGIASRMSIDTVRKASASADGVPLSISLHGD